MYVRVETIIRNLVISSCDLPLHCHYIGIIGFAEPTLHWIVH